MRRSHTALLVAALFAAPGCLTDDGTDADLSERAGEPGDRATDEVMSDPSELGHKVRICHVPPGNPGNAHTIEVSNSAVSAHLAHGDYLGACNEECDTPPQVCPPGQTWDCYSAPLSTDGIGACQRGTKTCNAAGSGWSACVGEVTPTTETCNGIDDDCDGTVDEGCNPTCVPTAEVCGDGLDNDCDGNLDEGCVCPPGEEWTCYTAPLSTDGIGACQRGIKTCNPDGMGYGACVGQITPTAETCNGIDDDCDGTVDEGCSACVPSAETCGDNVDNDCDGVADDGCVCAAGSSTACYVGPIGTEGVGTCHAGAQTCNATGTGYGACVGAVGPMADVCGDGLDNDCDGTADDGCVCAPGSAASCYAGPPGTDGVGVCHAGAQLCNAAGSGYGACVGSVGPGAEACGDGLDNDCDGVVDDNCVCEAGVREACYDGPAGTEGQGTCMPGAQTCNATGTGYGACVGSIGPVAEVCGDGLDNNCDGGVDEGCVCMPGTTAACYDGPAGTEGVGTCQAGSQACNGTGTSFGACAGSVGPAPEICGDDLDNDCDGFEDDGCVCAPGTAAACYTGPPAAAGVGVCLMGAQSCNSTGSGWDACVGSVLPAATDTCGDGLDNDCDGVVDDGCLGDRAWRDLNSNGVQNAGEPGLAGVTFTLCATTACTTAIATVVSDAAGVYYFSNVAPGTYFIKAAAPPGSFAMVGKDVGGNDNLDSDFDDEDLITSAIVVTATTSMNNIDAGFSGGGPI